MREANQSDKVLPFPKQLGGHTIMITFPSNSEGMPLIANSANNECHQTIGPDVLLFDPVVSRRDTVGRTIAEAGGSARLVELPALWNADKLANSGDLALVALGNGAGEARDALDLIGAFRKRGSEVFAYQDGIGHRPVQAKCLPLIAGATEVLDSGSAHFTSELRRLLLKAFEAQSNRGKAEKAVQALMEKHGMVGNSPAMLEVFNQTIRFSSLSDLPVLITGESGTGKELLARAIHAMDPRRQRGPFVAVNCGAINPSLVESELFGHRRGAFTGADRDRKGLIRAAEGGVLFLDEIGELDLGLQAKLLRVLQESSVLGLGEEHEVPVSVRFIAATNRDLERAVSEGKFRVDLYHRLRVLFMQIPPLRERPSDLCLLIEHFVRKHQPLNGEAPLAVSIEFVEAFKQMELPGNARQVENLVCSALANHRGEGEFVLHDLPTDVLRRLAEPIEAIGAQPASTGTASGPYRSAQEQVDEFAKLILKRADWNLLRAIRECERRFFAAAMQRTGSNQAETARLLGITRRSVYNSLKRLQPHC